MQNTTVIQIGSGVVLIIGSFIAAVVIQSNFPSYWDVSFRFLVASFFIGLGILISSASQVPYGGWIALALIGVGLMFGVGGYCQAIPPQ